MPSSWPAPESTVIGGGVLDCTDGNGREPSESRGFFASVDLIGDRVEEASFLDRSFRRSTLLFL